MVDNLNSDKIWKLLESIPDPEIPVISIVDLGIVRDVNVSNDQTIVSITPTYSGCPAMVAIENDIKKVLTNNSVSNLKIETVLSPAWTTDWMNDDAKKKLEAYGIAPPKPGILSDESVIPCPYCKSDNTSLKSEFGSTPCKAMFYCNQCQQPFEHFKCH